MLVLSWFVLHPISRTWTTLYYGIRETMVKWLVTESRKILAQVNITSITGSKVVAIVSQVSTFIEDLSFSVIKWRTVISRV